MPKNMKKWTDEQIEMLKNEWPNKSARKELAEKLGRTIPALRVKIESLKPKEDKPVQVKSRKKRVPKIAKKVEGKAQALATPEVIQELPTVNKNEFNRLKGILDSYFEEKKNTPIIDSGSLMLEGAILKGMKQMLALVNSAGYLPSSEKDKVMKALAKYEKELMWNALKEHFVNNQDED